MSKKQKLGFFAALLFMSLTFNASAGFREGLVDAKRGDFKAALSEFKPLADQGYADAQNGLGLMYENGSGVPQDYGQAVAWFRTAVDSWVDVVGPAGTTLLQPLAQTPVAPPARQPSVGMAAAAFNDAQSGAQATAPDPAAPPPTPSNEIDPTTGMSPEGDAAYNATSQGPSVWGAALRQDNVVGSMLSNALPGTDDTPVPGYSAWNDIKGTPYEQYGTQFADSNNPKYTAAIKAQIAQEQEDKQTLAAGGWTGTLAGFAAGLIDLPILIPVLGFEWLSLVVSEIGWTLMGGVALGAMTAGVTLSVREGLLQATQVTRLLSQSEYNVGVGTAVVLGLLLVGAGAAWSRKAADKGLANAQYSLGKLFYNGYGVPQNYGQAVAWFRMAADQGLAAAQLNIGWMYDNGYGVPQDYGHAVAWFRKAANQGDAAAQYGLGKMFYNGYGVPQDYGQAAAWFRKAAEQGYADAQNNLGAMYDNGHGVPRDLIVAYALYNLSAAKDFSHKSPATHNRNTHAEHMTPTQIEAGQALSRKMSVKGNLLRALDQYLAHPAN